MAIVLNSEKISVENWKKLREVSLANDKSIPGYVYKRYGANGRWDDKQHQYLFYFYSSELYTEFCLTWL